MTLGLLLTNALLLTWNGYYVAQRGKAWLLNLFAATFVLLVSVELMVRK